MIALMLDKVTLTPIVRLKPVFDPDPVGDRPAFGRDWLVSPRADDVSAKRGGLSKFDVFKANA